MHKKTRVKRIILALASVLITGSMISVLSHAHVGDFHSGFYLSSATCNQSNLKLKIETTAQTALLTSEVYYAAFDWNDISSNVDVSVAIAYSGMPSLSGFYSVHGKTYSDGTFGETIPRDSNGNIVSMDSNWYSVSIYMNTSAAIFNNDVEFATKSFVHEVGHALKLKHPTSNFNLTGHTYVGGYPKSIMNQNHPVDNKPWISPVVVQHDIDNLQGKWGG